MSDDEDIVGRIEKVRQSQLFSDELQPQPTPAKTHKLLPVRHVNRDFFLCDLFDYELKDDMATMQAPVFSLSTKPDLKEWRWESKNKKQWVEVIPSVRGRATQFDKDVLIYITSQMTEALDRKREDAKSRVVRFSAFDYLVATNKPTGGAEYDRLEKALDRLKGTMIKTNIANGDEKTHAFGLIDEWTIVKTSQSNKRMIAVEVKMSEWLYDAIQGEKILTLHPDYFRLRKPLERRLYEIARKHCGQQAKWPIGLELLQSQCSSKATMKEFKRTLNAIIQAKTIPEYRLTIDDSGQAVFYTKDEKKLAAAIVKK